MFNTYKISEKHVRYTYFYCIYKYVCIYLFEKFGQDTIYIDILHFF